MKVTPKEVADALGCKVQTVRLGLQQGVFPFGWAIKNEDRYTYVISEKLFKEYVKNE